MARLEYIHYEFFDATLDEHGKPTWETLQKQPIKDLPQIYWEDGSNWDEVNLWAAERAHEVELETIKRLMKHLVRYATFLEDKRADWRFFPARREDQVLRRFRKNLLDHVDTGELETSTASSCMRAAIQFYRFADRHELVNSQRPMWQDRLIVIPHVDAAGFKRSISRLTTDLTIPSRKRNGVVLEDGLLPLRAQHMNELLEFTAKNATEELHLMLSTGFFTGARVGTITTLSARSLETALEDPLSPGVFMLPVGPGTGISTKFSVRGSLLIPQAVLAELKRYASSTRRLLRQAKAGKGDKGLLFLTRAGKPYTPDSVARLNAEMRLRAFNAGLQFMRRFTLHQSRATFGTWLMQLLLDLGLSTTEAIRIVRDAMLHLHEKTTLDYVKFLEQSHVKQQAAAAFNEVFTGLRHRNWNALNA